MAYFGLFLVFYYLEMEAGHFLQLASYCQLRYGGTFITGEKLEEPAKEPKSSQYWLSNSLYV